MMIFIDMNHTKRNVTFRRIIDTFSAGYGCLFTRIYCIKLILFVLKFKQHRKYFLVLCKARSSIFHTPKWNHYKQLVFNDIVTFTLLFYLKYIFIWCKPIITILNNTQSSRLDSASDDCARLMDMTRDALTLSTSPTFYGQSPHLSHREPTMAFACMVMSALRIILWVWQT